MSKILAVVGSPRKNGNTHVLVSTILEGAQAEGASGELLLLGDLRIEECNGCHACWQGKPCSKRDDMNDVFPRIAESDAIIFGTPVYWYGPTALMKAFIDRFVYFNCPANRPMVRGKSAVLATPLEEDDPQGAQLLVALFDRCTDYLQMRPAGRIIVPGVGEKGEILGHPDVLEQARILGGRLARRPRDG